MQISIQNLVKLNKETDQKVNIKYPKLNFLSQDTFTSTISFEGKNKKSNKTQKKSKTERSEIGEEKRERFLQRIKDGEVTVVDPVTLEIIDDVETALSMYDKGVLYTIPKEKPKSVNEHYWDNFIKKFKDEILASDFLSIYSKKDTKKLLWQFKNNRSIEEVLSYCNKGPDQSKKLLQWLYNAKIDSVAKLCGLLKAFSNPRVKQIFQSSSLEFIEGYGLLENKTDMLKFPEIVSDLLVQSDDEEDRVQVHKRVNEYVSFLNTLGVDSTKDFADKFEYLRGDFNDFKTPFDVIDAIDYVASNYDKKIGLLQEALDSSQVKCKNTADLYLKNAEIIDYIFEQNGEENLSGLDGIIKYVGSKDITQKGVEALSKHFNDYSRVIDIIEFYEFLRDCEVNPEDFSKLAKSPITTGLKIEDNFINYAPLSKIIAKIQGSSIDEARKFYTSLKDIINVVYENKNKDTSYLTKLIKTAKANKISDSTSFLRLYNHLYKTNKKELSGDEIKEFVDLIEFAPNNNLGEIKLKTPKDSVIEILKKEQQQYIKIEKEIEDFIDNSQSSYFALDSSLDIYKKYKNELLNGTKPISETLDEITTLEANNSEEYQYKKAELDNFSNYFENKEDIIPFLRKNEITLEKKDAEYRKTCLEVLNLLSGEDTKDAYRYVLETDFIKKSKSVLYDFMNATLNKENLKNILKICAEKNIDSLGKFLNFLEKNGGEITNCSNLIEHLRRMPEDKSFGENQHLIKTLQKSIQKRHLSFKIQNSNILNIGIDEFLSGECSTQTINKLFGNPKETNPISILPEAFKKESERHSNYKIAREIVNEIDKTPESYAEISRLLQISKDDYIFTQYPLRDQIQIIKLRIPQEFFDFVNSTDWLYKKDGHIPNMSLHAKLRFIDRYALKGLDNINDLYSQETKNKLIEIQKEIYEKLPKEIAMSPKQARYSIVTEYNGKKINTIYTNSGKMVTISPLKDEVFYY